MKKSNSKAKAVSKSGWLDLKSLRPTLLELERLAILIQAWVQKHLPIPEGWSLTCVVTVEENPRLSEKSTCTGFFLAKGWKEKGSKQWIATIALTPAFLNRPILEIVSTLVHEILHAYCHLLGIKDCSLSGRHNQLFRDLAIKIGLTCALTSKTRGWSGTSLGEELEKIATEVWKADPEAFKYFKVLPGDKDAKSKAKANKTGLRCNCHPNGNGRVKFTLHIPSGIVDHHIICNWCKGRFEENN